MNIQIFTSPGIWPSSESQRKLRELWGFDSGPILELVAEELEAMAETGAIMLVVREVVIGAEDYLLVDVGDYSITPDVAQIIVDAGTPEILRVLSSTCEEGATVECGLIEKLREIKIYGAEVIAIHQAIERFGGKAATSIFTAIRGGLSVDDAISVVIAAMERGSDLAELTTGSATRTELRRRF